MMPEKILLATHNRGKIAEYKALFKQLPIELLTHDECPFDDIEENGYSFDENALQKAQAAYARYKMPIIAEDSGLCVEALGGGPGIYTARYGGYEKLLDAMKDEKNRSAHFFCSIAYINEQGKHTFFRGSMQGRIAEKARGNKGFGFDPVFIPENKAFTVAELDESIVAPIRHRTQAFKRLIETLQS